MTIVCVCFTVACLSVTQTLARKARQKVIEFNRCLGKKLMQSETDSKPIFLDRRLGRRKVQLERKFCFVFQCSFADKFSVACAFFFGLSRVLAY